MSQGQNAEASTVLLIEADSSLRRIISLGLQHRGMCVIEAASLTAVSSSVMHTLDLLVLDVDSGIASNWSLLEMIQAHPHLSTLPAVVLAWEGQLAQSTSSAVATATHTTITCLAKPFDARALYIAIERLLSLKAAQLAALEAEVEAILLASTRSSTPPTIWPIVTAAGLLLAVIGMLFQVAIVIVGFLVVFCGLLLWTLGTKPESAKVAIGVGQQ